MPPSTTSRGLGAAHQACVGQTDARSSVGGPGDGAGDERGSDSRAGTRERGAGENHGAGGESLLEVYFIDVGQGDGVLSRRRAPAHARRRRRQAGEPAHGQERGGLRRLEVLPGLPPGGGHARRDGASATSTPTTTAGWWTCSTSTTRKSWTPQRQRSRPSITRGSPGGRTRRRESMARRGVGGRGVLHAAHGGTEAKVVAATKAENANPKLHGEWADLMTAVTKTKTGEGTATPIRRLSHTDKFVPGFAGGNEARACGVLAPVEFVVDGKPAVRRFGWPRTGRERRRPAAAARLRAGAGSC